MKKSTFAEVSPGSSSQPVSGAVSALSRSMPTLTPEHRSQGLEAVRNDGLSTSSPTRLQVTLANQSRCAASATAATNSQGHAPSKVDGSSLNGTVSTTSVLAKSGLKSSQQPRAGLDPATVEELASDVSTASLEAKQSAKPEAGNESAVRTSELKDVSASPAHSIARLEDTNPILLLLSSVQPVPPAPRPAPSTSQVLTIAASPADAAPARIPVAAISETADAPVVTASARGSQPVSDSAASATFMRSARADIASGFAISLQGNQRATYPSTALSVDSNPAQGFAPGEAEAASPFFESVAMQMSAGIAATSFAMDLPPLSNPASIAASVSSPFFSDARLPAIPNSVAADLGIGKDKAMSAVPDSPAVMVPQLPIALSDADAPSLLKTSALAVSAVPPKTGTSAPVSNSGLPSPAGPLPAIARSGVEVQAATATPAASSSLASSQAEIAPPKTKANLTAAPVQSADAKDMLSLVDPGSAQAAVAVKALELGVPGNPTAPASASVANPTSPSRSVESNGDSPGPDGAAATGTDVNQDSTQFVQPVSSQAPAPLQERKAATPSSHRAPSESTHDTNATATAVVSPTTPPNPMPLATGQSNSSSPLLPVHQMLDSAPAAPVNGGGVSSSVSHVTADAALQMRVGIHTNAFGNVEIHTVVEQSQVGLSIHADHDLARWFSSEVIGLEAGLKGQHLNLAGVNFESTRSGVQTATSFQQGESRQNLPQPANFYAARSRDDGPAPPAETEPDPSAALPVLSRQARVSILI
jgi:hypothetical protein